VLFAVTAINILAAGGAEYTALSPAIAKNKLLIFHGFMIEYILFISLDQRHDT
jgi:hypothetical protein